MELARQMGRSFAPTPITSPLSTFSANVFDDGLVPSEFSMIDFSPLNRELASIRTIGNAKNALTDLFVLYAQCALMASPANLSLFYKVAPYIHDAIDNILSVVPSHFIAERYREKKDPRYRAEVAPNILGDVLWLWKEGFKEFMADKKLEFATQVGVVKARSDLSLRGKRVIYRRGERRVDSLFIEGLSEDTELSSVSINVNKDEVQQ
jgi:hypothetical protein